MAQATRAATGPRRLRRGVFTEQLRRRRSVGLEAVGELRGAVERLRAVRVLRVELPVYLVQQRLPANNTAVG